MAIVNQWARAKVNLTLRVLGRRPDGYHELISLVAFAAVGDRITLDSSFDRARTPADHVVSGPFAASIEGVDLVSRAIELVRRLRPELVVGRVALDKRLPVAAGLGGGSADAAAVLRAIRAVNPIRADAVDWLGLAQQLGADVPVCFVDRPTVMRGIGERMTRCCVPEISAVLVNPQLPVPVDKTRRVFQALAAGPLGSDCSRVAGDDARLDAGVADLGELVELMRRHGNDLEPPALKVMPAIAAVKAALLGSAGCRHAQLSGAGPTCFGVFGSAAEALAAAEALRAAEPSWWVEATTIGG